MDIEPGLFVDLLRCEENVGLVIQAFDPAHVRVVSSPNVKEITCALSEILGFRTVSRFSGTSPSLIDGKVESLKHTSEVLESVLATGMGSCGAAQLLQILSGYLPETLKFITSRAAFHATTPHTLVGKLAVQMLDVTIEWMKLVPKLGKYAEKLTTERINTSVGYVLVGVFSEMSYTLHMLLGLCTEQELPFGNIDVEVSYKRYKAIKYTSIPLINSIRSRFLEKSGYDLLVNLLKLSPKGSLEYRLTFLPIFGLSRTLSPENSESLYSSVLFEIQKIEKLEESAVRDSVLLPALAETGLQTHYPSSAFWQVVCQYAKLLLVSQDAQQVALGLKLLVQLIEADSKATVVQSGIMQCETSLLKLYTRRQHKETVTEALSGIVTRGIMSQETITRLSKGTKYLHLLRSLITTSMVSGTFSFLRQLSETDFPISKLGQDAANQYLEEMLAFNVPVQVILRLIPGYRDEQKLRIVLKHQNFELLERYSQDGLQHLLVLFPRRQGLLVYGLVKRRRLKMIWVMERTHRKLSDLPKVLKREVVSDYIDFGSNS